MFLYKIYSIFICILIISGFLTIEGQSIKASQIDQAQLENQNCRALKSSAEYNFILMFFGLAQRAKVANKGGHLSQNFAEQVEKVARANYNKAKFSSFDQVVNGKGPGIDWTEVHKDYKNYSVILDGVNGMVNKMTRNQSIRMSEVKRLGEFAQGVINYRSRLPNPDEQIPIIARWYSIEKNLDKILSEPRRFRTWSDIPEIEFYQEEHHKGPVFIIDELLEGKCLELPEPIRDRARAINSNGKCIILYYYARCQGQFRVFTPDTGFHENLPRLGFSKGPRSMKLC